MPAEDLEVAVLVISGRGRRTLEGEYSRKQGGATKQKVEKPCVLVRYTLTGSTIGTVVFTN